MRMEVDEGCIAVGAGVRVWRRGGGFLVAWGGGDAVGWGFDHYRQVRLGICVLGGKGTYQCQHSYAPNLPPETRGNDTQQ